MTTPQAESKQRWAIALETTPIIMVDESDLVDGRDLINELIRRRPLWELPYDKDRGDLFDEWQQWDEVRFLPEGTVFEIVDVIRTNLGNTIYVVKTDDHPCDEADSVGKVFVADSRFFGELLPQKPANRKIKCPDKKTILDRLKKAAKDRARYVWAGAYPGGTTLLEKFMNPEEIEALEDYDRKRLMGKGVDCSNYLRGATDGWTPPATYYMTDYGDQLDIVGKNAKEVMDILKPLDVIVWRGGHMGIVGDDDHVYHSILRKGDDGVWDGGVEKKPIAEFMKWVFEGDKHGGNKEPVNAITEENKGSSFVVSRWYDGPKRVKKPRVWMEVA